MNDLITAEEFFNLWVNYVDPETEQNETALQFYRENTSFFSDAEEVLLALSSRGWKIVKD